MKEPKYMGAKSNIKHDGVWHCESAGCRRYATRECLLTKDATVKRFLCEKHVQQGVMLGQIRAVQMLKEFKVYLRDKEKYEISQAASIEQEPML